MPDSLQKCWDGLKKKVLEFDQKYPTAHVICLAWIDNSIVCEGSDKIKKTSLEPIKEKYKNRLAVCTSAPVKPRHENRLTVCTSAPVTPRHENRLAVCTSASVTPRHENRIAVCTSPPLAHPDAQGTKGKDAASSNLPVLQLTLQVVNSPATNTNDKQTNDKSNTPAVAQLSVSALNTSTLFSKEKPDDPKIISSPPSPLGGNKSPMPCIVQLKHLAANTSTIKTRGRTKKEKYNQKKHCVPMVTRSCKSNGKCSTVKPTVGNVKDKNNTETYGQMKNSPTLSTISDGECSSTRDPGIGTKEKYTPTKPIAVITQSSPSCSNNSDPDIIIPLESIKTESILETSLSDEYDSAVESEELSSFDENREENREENVKKKKQSLRCDYGGCGKVFTLNKYLKRHLLIHCGNKPFVCDMCNKSFTVKRYLKRHMLTHTDDKSYKCEVCDKRFSNKDSVRPHMKMHTGDRDHICYVCGQGFYQKRYMLKHFNRTHTGNTTQCDVCSLWIRNDRVQKHTENHLCNKQSPGKLNLSRSAFGRPVNSSSSKGEQSSGKLNLSGSALGRLVNSRTPEGKKSASSTNIEIKKKYYQNKSASNPSSAKSISFLTTGSKTVENYDQSSKLDVNVTQPIDSGVAISDVPFTTDQAHPFKVTTTKNSNTVSKNVNFEDDLESQEAVENFEDSSIMDVNKSDNEIDLESQEAVENFEDSSMMDVNKSDIEMDSESKEAVEVLENLFGFSHTDISDSEVNNLDAASGENSSAPETGKSVVSIKIEPVLETSCSDEEHPLSCRKDEDWSSSAGPQVKEDVHVKKTLRCDYEGCGKEFKENKYFRKHLQTHSTVKSFVCAVCDKGFTVSRYLQRHMRLHTTSKKLLQCDVCGKGFRFKESLIPHMRIHSGKKDHVCKVCGKGFYDKKDMERHFKRQHTGNKTQCEVCSRWILNSMFQNHHAKHTGKKLHQCNVCNKMIYKKSDLVTHMRTHTGERRHLCDICGKGFTSATSHKYHMRTHTGEKPYSCDLCTKTFVNSTALRAHQRTHTGARPYLCDLCGDKFTQNESLRKHMRVIHKTFRCNLCDKGFNVETEFRRHMEKCTLDKTHICQKCGKGYTQKNGLNRHMKIHNRHVTIHNTHETCESEQCSKGFTQKNGQNTHTTIDNRDESGMATYTLINADGVYTTTNDITDVVVAERPTDEDSVVYFSQEYVIETTGL
ncbi:uncharacterized protein LOC143054979 [Mytilus galloprovincialis]|uniref:uncharacterized protein LOC143054979 n=1 Tax=Mytilus galloprovincialis TaxID=29158 RepID=UPI003F7BCFBE